MSSVARALPLSASVLLCGASCSREGPSYAEMVQDVVGGYGYIAGDDPLGMGTGTLVSGSPGNLHVEAAPEDCFFEDDVPRTSRKVLLRTLHRRSFKNKLQFLGSMPLLGEVLAPMMENVVSIEVEIKNLEREVLSAPSALRWYRGGMDAECRELLGYVSFVAEALLSDDVTVRFVRRTGAGSGSDDASLGDALRGLAGLGPFIGVAMEAEEDHALRITSPLLLGYKLAKFREEPEGTVLHRSASVEDGAFVFERTGFFKGPSIPIDPMSDEMSLYR